MPIEVISNFSSYHDGEEYDYRRIGRVMLQISNVNLIAKVCEGAIVLRYDDIDKPDGKLADNLLCVLKADVPDMNIDDVIEHDESMWVTGNVLLADDDEGG